MGEPTALEILRWVWQQATPAERRAFLATVCDKPKFDPKLTELPFATPAFRAAWCDWCDYRAERKPKLTERSVKLQLKDMTAWGEAAAIEAIHLAIRNGWQGIFPADKRKGHANGKAAQPSLRYDPSRDDQPDGDGFAFDEVGGHDAGTAAGAG